MPSMPRRSLVRRVGAVAAALCAALALLAPGSAQAAPVSTAPPAISGALEVGQTLTASTGAWTDPTSTITSYAYQWQRCLQYVCTDIDYATSPSYTLTQSDSGEQVDVVVTAYDAAGALEDAVSEQTYIIGSASGGSLYAIGEAVSGPGSVTGETTPLVVLKPISPALAPVAPPAPTRPAPRSRSPPSRRRAPPSLAGAAPVPAARPPAP